MLLTIANNVSEVTDLRISHPKRISPFRITFDPLLLGITITMPLMIENSRSRVAFAFC